MEFIDIPIPNKKESIPPDKSISSALEYLSTGESVVLLLHSTAKYLQNLTQSCGYIYYKIDQGHENLYICPTNLSESACLSLTYRWSIKRGETIAIYAFKRKKPILVDAITSVDLNFPYLQAIPTLHPRHILAIPLVNYHQVCYGVVEFYQNTFRTYSRTTALNCLPNGERLDNLVHATANYLKTLTNSTGYLFYSLDESLEELYICPPGLTETECYINRYKWSIDRGNTIAVYAYKHMTPILVDSFNSVDLNFPYLQGLPSMCPRYVLAMPLVNFHKRCYGVVEFYNHASRRNYTEFIDVTYSPNIVKPPDESLSTMVQFLPTSEQLNALLHSTAEYLRELTQSIGYIFYSFDAIDEDLYLCPPNAGDNECYETRYKWHMESGGTIAIYAFKKMTPILVDAFTSIDINFPYLQAFPGIEPRFILSIPLVSFEQSKFGVLEFFRNDTEPYSDVDVKLCQFLLQNCAEAFKQNESAVYFTKFNSVQLELQGLMEQYAFADDPNGSYKYLYQVVTMARDCTRAMSASLFFKKGNSLVKIVSTDEGFSFRKEDGAKDLGLIVRSVITSNFNTRLMNRNIHGMLRVRNKIGLSNFSLLDEQILESFEKMCTIWCIIEYMSGYLKKQRTLNNNLKSLINLQLQRAGDFGKRLKALVPSEPKILNSWSYILEISADERKLSSDLVVMINKVKGRLPVLEEPLRDFVVMVQQCHRSEGDDDYRTTVLAAQALYRLLDGCKGITKDNEAFAMMIAILAHNIAVIDEPTAESAIFGRYNQYADELTRFEICQFLIQETKLLNNLEEDDRNEILKLTKQYMVDLNLQCFKKHSVKFGKFANENDIMQLQTKSDPELRAYIQSLLPGIANVLGHLRSKQFLEEFPKFSLFKELEKEKLTCIDIIQTISPTYSYEY